MMSDPQIVGALVFPLPRDEARTQVSATDEPDHNPLGPPEGYTQLDDTYARIAQQTAWPPGTTATGAPDDPEAPTDNTVGGGLPLLPKEPYPTATPDPPGPGAPTITDITPNTGASNTTTPATITGTGFAASSTAMQDGSAFLTTYVSDTQLDCTVPGQLLAGTVQISVDTDGVVSNAVPFTVT